MDNDYYMTIFNESNSISEVLKKLNLHGNSLNWKKIKNIAIEVGFNIDIYKERKKIYCLNCSKELKRGQTKFCSHTCSAIISNKGRKHSEETKGKISLSVKKSDYFQKISKKEKKVKEIVVKEKTYCLNCGDELKYNKKYCSVKCSLEKKRYDNYNYFINNPSEFNKGNYTPKNFKDFILKEQNDMCSVCGNKPIWNNKEIIFVLDHIDGDASNNNRNNLRLVCPNCDSQLDTFKSKNKTSTRRNYWKEKFINSINNGSVLK